MAESVWDEQAGRSRLCSRECATCIFRPGNLMRLRPGRLKDLVREATATERVMNVDGSFIVCHSTLGADPAICRGFFKRYSTQSLQLMERLWGFTEVDPPEAERG